MSPQLVSEISIFVLAVFLGFEVISKVPTILHTPLMSGSNAIHGVILVGALLIMAAAHCAEPVNQSSGSCVFKYQSKRSQA